MPFFRYKAKNTAGEILDDVIEADNIKIVSGYLQDKGYFPLSIEEEQKAGGNMAAFKFKITTGDLVIFTSQIAELLKGGLPLARALELTVKQTENKRFKEIIQDVHDQLHKGSSLSNALAKYPQVFDPLYVGLVKAGESGGSLESSMERISRYLEQGQELLSKIKTALAYPLAMCVVGIATVFFLLMFVIPKFSMLFSDMEQVLPLPTRILIFASRVMKNWWWLYIPTIVLAATWLQRYLVTPSGQRRFDQFKLNIWIAGRIVREEMVIRFTRTLGILLSNGIPMISALEMVKKAVGNIVVSEEIERIYQEIKVGKGLVDPLSQSKIFPGVISDLVAAGQEVGSLESSLMKIADTYEGRVENALKAATSLMEPIVILIMGLMVGFIVLAMLLPIFEISGAIK
jgi:general secretion pathway protein F